MGATLVEVTMVPSPKSHQELLSEPVPVYELVSVNVNTEPKQGLGAAEENPTMGAAVSEMVLVVSPTQPSEETMRRFTLKVPGPANNLLVSFDTLVLASGKVYNHWLMLKPLAETI